ncbi:MAG TPA: efflux RND transporter periplasmic adaptor subunit [Victivallales bacterium]|nr:efflux RND transporter periplasmic adaptor subunit [Victivallales bacterium]
MNFFKKTNIKSLILVALASIAVIIVLFFVFFSDFGSNASKEKGMDRFFTVKRGDLVTGVFMSGNVNAKEKHKISLEANFKAPLAWIIPENSDVKKGDLLASLDTEELAQKIEELDLTLRNLIQERDIAIEEITIQKSANEAEKKVAEDGLLEAEEAFAKYRRLEGPKESDSQKVKMEEAKKLLDDAAKDCSQIITEYNQTVFMDELDKKKMMEKITALEKKQQTEKINYNNSVIDRKIFRRFTYPNTLSQLMNKIEQQKLNLNSVRVKTSSQLLQKENQLAKIESQISKNKYDLERHKEYMKQMKLTAPVDGIVTYGDHDNRRGGQQEIKVGMDVRRKEVLMTIPDMKELVVEFDLPEQYRSRVSIGDQVVMRPDSRPNLKLKGRVSYIAPTPVNQIYWDRNSPKIYPSKIEFDERPENVVSGTSVRIEIITNTLKNVIYVPLEAVFDESGKYFVYLKMNGTPEIREVKIGESNDYYVEILEGLKESDTVYLYRPFQK